MQVAVAQIESVLGNLDANLRKHLEVIDAARAAGIELLLFPELSLTGHGAGPDTLHLAIGGDHDAVKRIAKAAGSMVTLLGLIEEAPAVLFYNSAIAVRDGKPAFLHRKINLATYGKLEDGKHFAAGSHVHTLDLSPRWRAGILICADPKSLYVDVTPDVLKKFPEKFELQVRDAVIKGMKDNKPDEALKAAVKLIQDQVAKGKP